jgi:hypothetical protein
MSEELSHYAHGIRSAFVSEDHDREARQVARSEYLALLAGPDPDSRLQQAILRQQARHSRAVEAIKARRERVVRLAQEHFSGSPPDLLEAIVSYAMNEPMGRISSGSVQQLQAACALIESSQWAGLWTRHIFADTDELIAREIGTARRLEVLYAIDAEFGDGSISIPLEQPVAVLPNEQDLTPSQPETELAAELAKLEQRIDLFSKYINPASKHDYLQRLKEETTYDGVWEMYERDRDLLGLKEGDEGYFKNITSLRRAMQQYRKKQLQPNKRTP